MAHYFQYDQEVLKYLKEKDKILGRAMDEIGPVRREVDPDLYSALVLQIISQQISTKGSLTIWARLREALGEISPGAVAGASDELIQKCGTSMRKVTYIKDLTRKVLVGELDLQGLQGLPDEEVCQNLSELKGIGIWTAEMLMTFSMQRPDIMSWGDMAIHRGLRMIYRHRRITRELFDKYRRRYSPYATVASLYLWAVAGGACPGLSDPAPKSEGRKKSKQKK